jgi:hypothetical protein
MGGKIGDTVCVEGAPHDRRSSTTRFCDSPFDNVLRLLSELGETG